MTLAAPLPTRPAVDPLRWPDLTAHRAARGIAARGASVRGALETAVARRIFLSAIERLPVRIQMGDARVVGGAAGDPDAPLMVLDRPAPVFAAQGADGLVGLGES